MARKINWSFEAANDLEAIADYIAKDSRYYAAAFVSEIWEASTTLKEFSEEGESFLNCLILVYGSYLLKTTGLSTILKNHELLYWA